MAWLKIDDGMPDHEKWIDLQDRWPELWAPCMAIWTVAACYAAEQLTDGRVSMPVLRRRTPLSREQIQAAADALVEVGLWDERDGEIWIHDYLDYNDSRETILAKRAKDSERKRKDGAKGGVSAGSARRATPVGLQTDSARNPDGLQTVSEAPDPTRPDPTVVTTTTAPRARDMHAVDLEPVRARYEQLGRELDPDGWQTGDLAGRTNEITKAARAHVGPDKPLPAAAVLMRAVECAAAQAAAHRALGNDGAVGLYRALWRSPDVLSRALDHPSPEHAAAEVRRAAERGRKGARAGPARDVRVGRVEPKPPEAYEADIGKAF